MSKSLFVTGCNGFIGKNLVHYFLARKWKVLGLSRLEPNFCSKNFTWIKGELSNFNLEKKNIDYCVHTAGISPRHSSNPLDFLKNNTLGTKCLLDKLTKTNCKGLIFLSGVSVYGKVKDKFVDENTNFNKPNDYGLSKIFSEIILKSQTNIPSCILRLPGVIGKNSTSPWLCKQIINISKNNDILIYNPESLFNNIVYINDLNDFILKMIRERICVFNKTFVLGGHEKIKVFDLIKFLIKNFNSSSNIIINNSNTNSFYINDNNARKYGYISSSIENIVNDFF